MEFGVPVSKSLSNSYERNSHLSPTNFGPFSGGFSGFSGFSGPPTSFGSFGAQNSFGSASLGTSPNYKHSALLFDRYLFLKFIVTF